MASATNGTVGIGTFFVEGLTLASAFSNPLRLDLIQVVNDVGKVVWNLTADGEIFLESRSPTPSALLGQFRGATFAQAFPDNPMDFDVLQVAGPDGVGIFHLDYTGKAFMD
jgi:hypothetical protein